MPKIHGYTVRKGSFHGGGDEGYKCVDVLLSSMRSTEDIFWSRRSNSYVLVEGGDFHLTDGRTAQLLSVNGIGEVRWPVWVSQIKQAVEMEAEGKLKPDYDSFEQLEAARHFGLAEAKK